jgi:hypothetical protein
MQISLEGFIVVTWPVAAALILGLLWANDGIVRHICRREGRRYAIFWPFGWYWHFRSFSFEWFREAKAAEYFERLVVLTAFWIVFAIVAIVLQAGGFVYANPPLVDR